MGVFSETAKHNMLNAQFRNVSLQNAAVWAKLHTGDPGAAGTANPFSDTTRVQLTLAAPSAGVILSSAAAEWTELSAGGTLTHVSLWTASTGGTHLGNDDLPVSKAVNADDTFRIPSGDISLAINDS